MEDKGKGRGRGKGRDKQPRQDDSFDKPNEPQRKGKKKQSHVQQQDPKLNIGEVKQWPTIGGHSAPAQVSPTGGSVSVDVPAPWSSAATPILSAGETSGTTPQNISTPGTSGGEVGKKKEYAKTKDIHTEKIIKPEIQQSQQPSQAISPIENLSTQLGKVDIAPAPEKKKKAYVKHKDLRAAKKLQAEVASSVPTQSSAASTVPSEEIQKVKSPGTNGYRQLIFTNYLEIIVNKIVSQAYYYDVTIEPSLPKKLLPKVFEKFRLTNYPNIYIAFDGFKNAYSPCKLNENNLRNKGNAVKINDNNGREREFKIELKATKGEPIDLTVLKKYDKYDCPLKAIQVLDIVFKSVLANKNGVQAGRSFFMRPNVMVGLEDGYELWHGLFQSALLCSKPYLNVDITHKAFPSAQTVLQLISSIGLDYNRELQKYEIERLHAILKGVTLTYEIPGSARPKSYKYFELTPSAKRATFMVEKNKITVFNYFQSKGIILNYPEMPCLSVGVVEKGVWLPAEFCSIKPGQLVQKKCTSNQTRTIIRHAATSTETRKDNIYNLLNNIKHNDSNILKSFGIEIKKDFQSIQSRILDPPVIIYKNCSIKPNRGSWMDSKTTSTYIIPEKLTNWAILLIGYVPIGEFGAKIISLSSKRNMQIANRYDVLQLGVNCSDRDIENIMNKCINQKIELLFVVIPDSGSIYAKVKIAAEIRCGILTQCVKQLTVKKKSNDTATINNILLKVNSKLNGTSHKLNEAEYFKNETFMFVGADVTHPSPDQLSYPSVVGVAASCDAYAFRYNMCWRIQGPKQEMIKDFYAIMCEQLDDYFKTNNKLPDKIIYYRDGVSEGQFQECLNVELTALRRACQQRQENYNPNITFIIVQKRHHTRFFPPQRQGEGKNSNVFPGTVVDTEITQPNETQFFLVSHQSIQGVARPTKYCVLRDDSELTMDKLQSITYNLCHMFARCNRSVSYPAPTYYAHLAAYRGRVYLDGSGHKLNMENLTREFEIRKIKDVIIKGHPMYFI